MKYFFEQILENAIQQNLATDVRSILTKNRWYIINVEANGEIKNEEIVLFEGGTFSKIFGSQNKLTFYKEGVKNEGTWQYKSKARILEINEKAYEVKIFLLNDLGDFIFLQTIGKPDGLLLAKRNLEGKNIITAKDLYSKKKEEIKKSSSVKKPIEKENRTDSSVVFSITDYTNHLFYSDLDKKESQLEEAYKKGIISDQEFNSKKIEVANIKKIRIDTLILEIEEELLKKIEKESIEFTQSEIKEIEKLVEQSILTKEEFVVKKKTLISDKRNELFEKYHSNLKLEKGTEIFNLQSNEKGSFISWHENIFAKIWVDNSFYKVGHFEYWKKYDLTLSKKRSDYFFNFE